MFHAINLLSGTSRIHQSGIQVASASKALGPTLVLSRCWPGTGRRPPRRGNGSGGHEV